MAAAAVAAAVVRLPAVAQPRLAAAEAVAAGAVRVRQQLRSVVGITKTTACNAACFPLAAAPRRLGTLLLAAVAEGQEVVTEEALEDGVAEEESASQEVAAEVQTTTKIFFGNLPYNIDSAKLAGVVQEIANPELVEVIYDKETGRSRGFGFVTMNTVEDCDAVIEALDRSELGGRILSVNYADKPKKGPLFRESPHKTFVGNLSWSVTSESLAKVLKEHANVVSARVIIDGETGRSRGYGFASFETKEDMEAVINALTGVELDGRPLQFSPAQDRRSN